MTLQDAGGREILVGSQVYVMGRRELERGVVSSIRVQCVDYSYTAGAPLRNRTTVRIKLNTPNSRWGRLCTNPRKLLVVGP